MALIKVVRDEPEVAGGNTYAYVSEENIREVLSNGWRRADDKKETKETKETKEEVKPVADEKTEPKVEEVEKPKTEVKEGKKPKKAL